MTSAALVLLTSAIAVGILYIVMIFLQFLVQSAICAGCGVALLEINTSAPTDMELFAMTALMAVIAISLFRAFQAWRVAIGRVKAG